MPNDVLSGQDLAALSVLSSALDPVPPLGSIRERLLTAVDGPLRYLPFVRELAMHFDLTVDSAREILTRVGSREGWTAGVWPIAGFFHFRPGPRLAPLRGGLVRMEAGAGFPLHRHRDRELTLVLEGCMIDESGASFGPGRVLDMEPGSAHSLCVAESGNALLALLHGSIEMLGE